MNEPFIIINADDYYGPEAFQKAGSFLENTHPGKLEAALVGFLLKNTLSGHGSVARGICRDNGNGVLADVEEVFGIRRLEDCSIISDNRQNLKDDDLVSINMWAFSPEIFRYTQNYFYSFLRKEIDNLKAEFFIPMIVSRLIIEEGTAVIILESGSQWHGVTYWEDKPEVVAAIRDFIDAGLYPDNLWEKTE